MKLMIHSQQIDFKDLFWEPHEKILRWCQLPYPGHPKGCPNSGSCKFFYKDLEKILASRNEIHIAWVEFDIDAWALMMKEKHPTWSEKQCRNLLYWQRTLRSKLKFGTALMFPRYHVILGAEGGGINFYRTMKKLGVKLDKMNDLHIVRVIAIVVRRENGLERYA